MDWDDTIVALATPSARLGGIRSIVRLSGPAAATICQSLLSPPISPALFAEQAQAESCLLRLDDWNRQVEALVYWWPAGGSYTGQPTVEFHLPACDPLVDAVIAACVTAGARLARPGEFTLRAFLSGRLDLVQAEGIVGMIEAETAEQLTQALAQRTGGLSRQVAQAREQLTDLLADVEAGLDFVTEDISFVSDDQLAARLADQLAELERLAGDLEHRGINDPFPRVVLVGPANAGKSTLFNALVGDHRALVSASAGTTRDYLTAITNIGPYTIELVDTAGQEEQPDAIQAQAAALRNQALASADLWLECLPVDTGDGWSTAAESVPSAPRLRLRTMADRAPEFADPLADAIVTAVTRDGLEPLRQALVRHFDRVRSKRSTASLPLRCRTALTGAITALREAQQAHALELGHEYVAASLRQALDELGEILGVVYSDDLLGRIFSRFCIGK